MRLVLLLAGLALGVSSAVLWAIGERLHPSIGISYGVYVLASTAKRSAS